MFNVNIIYNIVTSFFKSQALCCMCCAFFWD